MRTKAEIDAMIGTMIGQSSVTRAPDFIHGVIDALLWTIADWPEQIPASMAGWDFIARRDGWGSSGTVPTASAAVARRMPGDGEPVVRLGLQSWDGETFEMDLAPTVALGLMRALRAALPDPR
jgi:hypothetical protein